MNIIEEGIIKFMSANTIEELTTKQTIEVDEKTFIVEVTISEIVTLDD